MENLRCLDSALNETFRKSSGEQQKKKIKQSINPSETQIIHLTSTKFFRLELLKKILSLHKHRNIILKLHDPNQRKMGSHVLSDHGIP